MGKKEVSLGRKEMITVYIYQRQLERLKRLSELTRVPRAVYIREGLDFVLNKYERKLGKKNVES